MDVWFLIEKDPPPRGTNALKSAEEFRSRASPQRVRRAFALLTRTYHGCPYTANPDESVACVELHEMSGCFLCNSKSERVAVELFRTLEVIEKMVDEMGFEPTPSSLRTMYILS